MENIDRINANYNRILNDSIMTPQYASQFVMNTGSNMVFLAINEEEDFIVTGGDANNLFVVDLDDGKVLEGIAFESPISAVELYDNKTKALVATDDLKLYSLDLESLEKEVIVENTEERIIEIANYNDTYIVTVILNAFIDVYDGKDLSLITSENSLIEGGQGEESAIRRYRALRFYQNGDYIMAYDDGSIVQKNLYDKSIVNEIAGPTSGDYQRKINIHRGNGLLVYSNLVEGPEFKYENLVVLDYKTGEKIEIVNAPTGNLRIIDQGKKLIMNDNFGKVFIYDLEKEKYDKAIKFPENIKKLAVDEENKRIAAVCGENNEIYISEIVSLQFINDGENIVSLARDSSIKVYGTESNLVHREILGGIKAISSDHDTILIIDNSNAILSYKFSTDQVRYIDNISEEFNGILNAYAISNDGELFAITQPGDRNATVLGSDGIAKYFTRAHDKGEKYMFVSDVRFSENGGYIFTLFEDGTVFVSDINTGEFIRELKDYREPNSKIIVSEDGSVLSISYKSGKSSIFNIESGEKIDEITGELLYLQGSDGKLDKARGIYGSRLFEYENRQTTYYAASAARDSQAFYDMSSDFISKDGNYLLTSVSGGDLVVTDLSTGYRVRTLKTGENTHYRSVISSTNDKIAYEYSADKIYITNNYSQDQLTKISEDLIGERVLTDRELNEIGLVRSSGNEE